MFHSHHLKRNPPTGSAPFRQLDKLLPSGRSKEDELAAEQLSSLDGAQSQGGPERCRFYLKTGTCRFGNQCKYRHPGIDHEHMRERGYNKELNIPRICQDYLNTGHCRFGASCRSIHIEPETPFHSKKQKIQQQDSTRSVRMQQQYARRKRAASLGNNYSEPSMSMEHSDIFSDQEYFSHIPAKRNREFHPRTNQERSEIPFEEFPNPVQTRNEEIVWQIKTLYEDAKQAADLMHFENKKLRNDLTLAHKDLKEKTALLTECKQDARNEIGKVEEKQKKCQERANTFEKKISQLSKDRETEMLKVSETTVKLAKEKMCLKEEYDELLKQFEEKDRKLKEKEKDEKEEKVKIEAEQKAGQEKYNALREKYEALERKSQQEAKKLNDTINELKRDSERASAKHKSCTFDLQLSKKEAAALRDSIEDIETEKTNLKKALEKAQVDHEKELASLNESVILPLKANEETIKKQKSELESLEQKLCNAENKLNDALQVQKKENNFFDKQTYNSQQTIENLKKDLGDLHNLLKKKDALSQRHTSALAEKDLLIKDQMKLLEYKNLCLDEKDTEIQQLQKELEPMKLEVAISKKSMQEKERYLEQHLKNVGCETQKKLAEEAERWAAKKKMEDDRIELDKLLEEAKKKAAEAKQHAAQLSEKAEKVKKVASLEAKHEELVAELEEWRGEAIRVSEEYNSQLNNQTKMKECVQEKEDQILELQQTITDLKLELQKAKELEQQAKQNLDKVKAEGEGGRRRLKELESHMAKEKQRGKAMKAERAAAKRKREEKYMERDKRLAELLAKNEEMIEEQAKWKTKALRLKERLRSKEIEVHKMEVDTPSPARKREKKGSAPKSKSPATTKSLSMKRSNVDVENIMQDSLAIHEATLRTRKEIQSFEKKWALKNAFCFNMIETWNLLEAYRKQFNKMKRQNLVSHLSIDEDYRRPLVVNREDAVGDIFKSPLFKASKLHGQHSAFANLEVRFVIGKGAAREIEDGIDANGLSNELNSLFWEQLETYCVEDMEFEGKNEDNKVQLFDKESDNSILFLPVIYCDGENKPYELTKQLMQMYEIVGRFFLRAFLNNMTVPSAFASNILMDYLLNFDLRYSMKNLQEMLSDLMAVDPSYSWVQKVIEDKSSVCGDLLMDGDDRPLQGENARACLKKFIKQRVIDPREKQFQAIAKGFFLDNTFSVGPFLEICSNPKELRLLVSGEEIFDVNRLWDIIDLQGFGKTEDTTREYLRAVLEEMSEKELRLFLKFVTGLFALPMNNKAEALRITVKPDKHVTEGVRFPQAQTCDRQLILPDYRSKDEMQKRLLEAIQPDNSRFMLK